MRTTSWRAGRGRRSKTAAALLVGAAIACGGVVTPDAHAAPRRGKKTDGGLERSRAFVNEGDVALEAGDYEEAVAKYTAAYYGLKADARASYAGSLPVRKAMRAYDLLVAQNLSRAVLDRQLGFVTEFLESVKARPDGRERVGEAVIEELELERAKIEKKIAELSEVAAPGHEDDQDEPVEDPEPATDDAEPLEAEQEQTDPDPAPGPVDQDKGEESSGARAAGIGLAAGGGVLLGVGAGVLAGWWTVRSSAEDELDSAVNSNFGYEEGSAEREQYVADMNDRARGFLIGGVVTMGVGVGLAAAGVALLVKHRRSSGPSLSLAPQLGPGRTGVVLRGRF